MILLIDDGTLDTVLCCSECGEEIRYSYSCTDITRNDAVADDTLQAYDEFVEWAIEDATTDHECGQENTDDN